MTPCIHDDGSTNDKKSNSKIEGLMNHLLYDRSDDDNDDNEE